MKIGFLEGNMSIQNDNRVPLLTTASANEVAETSWPFHSFTQDIKGCSIPIKIPVNGDGKALNNAEGFFDQIDKDLNVILEWLYGFSVEWTVSVWTI